METKTVRVLGIVEDEPDIRLLLRLVLSGDSRLELGGEATSAEAALELAREWNPDLVILDQSLDGALTGIEAAPLFKAVLPDLQILLFSAYDLQRETEGNPSIDRFLRKDQMPELLPTISSMLGLD